MSSTILSGINSVLQYVSRFITDTLGWFEDIDFTILWSPFGLPSDLSSVLTFLLGFVMLLLALGILKKIAIGIAALGG